MRTLLSLAILCSLVSGCSTVNPDDAKCSDDRQGLKPPFQPSESIQMAQ